jgi:putative iron-only hydrogenase system regulator
MEKKIAAIIILVKFGTNTYLLNKILSGYAEHIIGRQGINIRHRKIAIITLIIEANTDIIGAISGKIGRLQGCKVKTAMLKLTLN